MPWLLEVLAYNIAGSAMETLRFSDVGLTTSPSDSPANTYWLRRIHVPPSTVRALVAGEAFGGRSESSLGSISLANHDGALDHLALYGWAGHPITIRYTSVAQPVLSDFSTLLVGATESATVGDNLEITITERRRLAQRSHVNARFAGSGGAEGGSDWGNVRKPRALGVCFQIEPSILDEPNLVYVMADAPIGGVMQARDKGVPLRRGGNNSTYAEMLSAGFVDADFVTCDADAAIRLRTPPSSPLTLDILGLRSGVQLITNGAFAGGAAGWSLGANWAWSASGGGRIEKTAGAAGAATQAVATEAGAWYAIGVSSERTSLTGLNNLLGDSVLVGEVSTDRRRAYVFQATDTSTLLELSANSAWAGWIDNVSMFQVFARAGEMMREVIVRDTPLTTSDIETADIVALHAASGAALGYYQPPGTEALVADVLDQIAQTVGAAWGFDAATGRFRVRRIDAPSVIPDRTLAARDIISIAPRQAELRTRSVTVRSARRWRPLQQSEVAGAVTDMTRAALILPHVESVQTSSAVTTETDLSRQDVVDSLFSYAAAGAAEATRRRDLYSPHRLAFEVQAANVAALREGDTVRLEHPRYGIAGGRNFRVLRLARDGESDVMTLTLWG